MVALRILAMPQLLLLFTAGAAGILFVRRWYVHERQRIAGDLARAKEAMEQRNAKPIVPLELDPATGIYRPKRLS